ncbi:leucine zipper protein 2 isoform X2 [Tympanuchus pallidicinctus]|uniref:leucine zipper protein 2 isoform X2 n=1 Tax=Tympanuchus pallidicinctus TaxID=109042 RepID=UPI0022873375|nr:leucine zipper protein 2 isoform X2 [Tympanuchus pallidicinctus]
MKFFPAYYLLLLFPALVFSARQGYEELERQLKEVFKERSNILHELLKTSKELEGIKVNLQSLKNDEASARSDVQKLLELGQKQREEMKSLQEAFQKQLKEAAEKAEKQQATINFLKTEMERKSKMIRALQNENKSLKNKLLSGNKLCGIHAEESKKIQAQLKELRYGKKDLIFKAQQLTDLEQKLAVAKDELEKAALDEESQLKALKETVKLCLSFVLHNQPPANHRVPTKPAEKLTSIATKGSKLQFPVTSTKQNTSAEKESLHMTSRKEENQSIQECDSQDVGKTCLGNRNNSASQLKTAETETSFQMLRNPLWIKPEEEKSPERNEKKSEDSVSAKEKKL